MSDLTLTAGRGHDSHPSRRDAACDYCHLPVAATSAPADGPVYCCFGCRLASEITAHNGPEGEVRWTLARLGLAIFLSLNVMMFTMALWTQDLYDARAAGSGPLATTLADLFRYLCLLLSVPVLWLLGLPLLENAFATRRRDEAAAELLIVVGVVAAYGYSIISVLRGSGHVYFEVGCAVLVSVTIGRLLEATGKLRTTKSLDTLERLLPDRVRIVDNDGRPREVATDDVHCGDRLRVLAGERIATDGRVIVGCASICQQLLTGESHPVTKCPGDHVMGGSTNLDGELLIDVSAPVHEGSLARLIELVHAARMTKGTYQRLADRVAGWFLPIVIVVAGGAFAYHLWQSGIDAALLSSLAVLLIACPCALGLATPMTVWTALGTGARHGVLFRHGEALERLATIRAVRFDKTGTLSTGTPQVEDFIMADPANLAQVASRAYRLAAASGHVFSQSIVRFLSPCEKDEQNDSACDVTTHGGQGVAARFDNESDVSRLGSLRWLEAAGLPIPAELAQEVVAARRDARSLSAIGWRGRVRGLFIFSETMRSGASAALAQCTALGCDVAVLTGDELARTRSLAEQLGVPVIAGLLPEEKMAALAEARRQIGPVAMVGDGINDAPALVASDLGIAMGCGADLSRESAMICLMTNDLARVAWAIRLARRSVRVIRQNLFWAFGYNTLGIALAAAGQLNPAWAAAAMVASSMFVVTNSLRLQTGTLEPTRKPTESIVRDAQLEGSKLEPANNELASPLSIS